MAATKLAQRQIPALEYSQLDFTVQSAPATPDPDVITIYLTGSGTTPDRVLEWKLKDENGDEVILSSLIV